ncbi:MAG: sigma-54-dependent Fis family transcriptional regulator [Acidobacteria bacterium]|nr:sigma-54-dependent Fis family transcriptional regulator [Acidobacteriota bacterium]
MTAPHASPGSRGKVLVIDDEIDIREGLELLLTTEGYLADTAHNGGQGLEKLSANSYDLVLLDLMMPDIGGMEVLEEFRKRDRETPVFMITAYGSVEAAVKALKLGANDYFSKPWDNDKLIIEIDRMIERRRLEWENTHLKRALKQRYNFPNIIGKSERMLRLLDLVGQVANSRSTIMITGETGTGKELVAKAIHANSPRADQMFVAVNSGSLPPELLESTLFGHVKGAFTSAIQTKKGYFEVADKGTIFFDEIGNLGPETQIKLLRVLQEKEFTPLGATDPQKVDVRILAATNADLAQLVKDGKFREDLYYRLNVINISLPSLRERKEDIPPLVSHFFNFYCRENDKFLDDSGRSRLQFAPDAVQILMEYNWPGNVRELENVVERAVVLAVEEVVPVDVLPDTVLQASGVRVARAEGSPLPADASLFEIVNDFERRTILDRLERCSWSQTEAAESLRVPLSTLNQKIKRLDIKIKRKGEQ